MPKFKKDPFGRRLPHTGFLPRDEKTTSSQPIDISGILESAQDALRDEMNGHQNPFIQPDGSTVGYDDIMNRLNFQYPGQLDWLNNFGISGGSMSLSQTADWNKQVLDTMLQYMMMQNQRDYDRSVLEEQRAYDNPQTAMLRLMATGMSRDAAMQMLSGSTGAAGAAALVGSGSGISTPQGVSATQSTANTMQAAKAAFDIIGTAGSLVSLGFSIPSAISQANILANSAFMSTEQRAGYDAAKKVSSFFSNGLASGDIAADLVDGFSNATDSLKWLVDNPDAPGVKNLTDSGALAAVMGTEYGSEAYNRFWNNLRSSRDAGTMLDQMIKNNDLKNALDSITIEEVGAQIEAIGQSNKESEQRIAESIKRVAQIDADIQLKNKEGEWISVQTKWYGQKTSAEILALQASANASDAQAHLADVTAYGQGIQNQYNEDLFEVSHAGIPMLKQCHLIELDQELRKLQFQNDYDGRKKQLQAWALEQDNAIKLQYLNSIYYNASGDFARNHPDLWNLAVGFQSCGAGELVRTGGTAATSVIKAGARLAPKIP